MNNGSKDELAEYLFHQGTNYRAYEYLGAHDGGEGNIVFRVWAPSAREVFLAGDFNGWGYSHPMVRTSGGRIWEISVSREELLCENFRYKYIIRGGNGDVYKADPYGFFCECPPKTASVFYDLRGYEWKDEGWLKHRWDAYSRDSFYSQPINIYELHPLSWRRHHDGRPYGWTELAEELAPYVKQMGYTHVELMPVTEHPYDGSWGYQVTGYFASTARLGTPRELMAFIDKMHCAGIGVILDWVPGHFPKDAHGLYEFDGGSLYEYGDHRRGEHKGWGTRCFDLGRTEVQSFLVSSADLWVRLFHADGLRVDAVASMLYRDYDRGHGEWTPNSFGDNRDLEGEAFFKKLNGHIRGEFPDVMMIAEESTDWRGVTEWIDKGLGFSMKWDMGWMNDTLSYMSLDPIYRKYHHSRLTFPMMYAFGERYTMPISHDEVVHGKGSLAGKLPGGEWERMASVRVLMGYMMTRPGKKLTFMGCETGQLSEWRCDGQVEWSLLEREQNGGLQRYFAELGHFYLEEPALWQEDGSWEGFEWIEADNADDSVISYKRYSSPDENGEREVLYVVLNFTPVMRREKRLRVNGEGRYRQVFNSDGREYGGGGRVYNEPISAVRQYDGGHDVIFDLPPLSAVILKRIDK